MNRFNLEDWFSAVSMKNTKMSIEPRATRRDLHSRIRAFQFGNSFVSEDYAEIGVDAAENELSRVGDRGTSKR